MPNPFERPRRISSTSLPTHAVAPASCLGPSPRQAGVHAFYDHPPLELGEEPAHRQHGLSCGCGRVYGLLVKVQTDAELTHLGHESHDVVQVPPEPIDAPRQDDVELAAGGILAELVERRPPLAALGAADAVVLIDLRDLPPPLLGDAAKLAQLVGVCPLVEILR